MADMAKFEQVLSQVGEEKARLIAGKVSSLDASKRDAFITEINSTFTKEIPVNENPPSFLEGLFTEPEAAGIRGGIRAAGKLQNPVEAFKKSRTNFREEETFTEEFIKASDKKLMDKTAKTLMLIPQYRSLSAAKQADLLAAATSAPAIVSGFVGAGADIATNPVDAVLTFFGAKIFRLVKRIPGIGKSSKALLKQYQNLTRTFKRGSEVKASEVKGMVSSFTKEARANYGKSLDVIEERIIKKSLTDPKSRISNAEVIDAAEDALTKGRDMGLTGQERTMTTLSKISKNLSEKKAGVGLLDEFGKPLKLDIVEDAQSVRSVINIKQNAQKAMTPGARKGTTGLTREDIPIEIFRKNIAQKLEHLDSGLKTLNESYGEVMDIVRFAEKQFQPRASKFVLNKGAALLRKFAKGTTSGEGAIGGIGESGFFQAFERGNKLATGRKVGIDLLKKQAKTIDELIGAAKQAAKVERFVSIGAGATAIGLGTSALLRRSLRGLVGDGGSRGGGGGDF